MPIIPNSSPPEPEQPSAEVKDPDLYRFEGFDMHGGNQNVMVRDMQRDKLIWNPRQISQPAIWSRRATSSFRMDMRQ